MRVINVHSIKPIDEEVIIGSAIETGGIVTAEEHNVLGGLGEAVAGVLSNEEPVPIEMVGIRDHFCSISSHEELLDKYNLNAKGRCSSIRKVLKKYK